MIDQNVANILLMIMQRKLGAPDLFKICAQLSAENKTELAISFYRSWVELNPGDPLLPAVLFNLGVQLAEIGDQAGAALAYLTAVKLRPEFVPPRLNLGSLVERTGAIGDAVTHWLAVVNALANVTGETVNHKLIALKHIGRVLEKTHLESSAEDSLRQAIEIRPDADAIQHWISLRQSQCEWPVMTEIANVSRETLFSGMSPHCLIFHTDDPLLHLARGHGYYQRKVGRPAGAFHAKHRPPAGKSANHRRIRVGYISSYLREHAHGYLTAGMYEMHDRGKFEVFAYSLIPDSGDRIEQRIQAGVDHWVNLSALTDEQAAKKIFDDGIDILIDFNGYTGAARLNIVALRPAPIIVNWLGYPGSMGTPYHNYIIADDFIIPPDSEKYYSEKVLRLPCYQPNDRLRQVADRQWTRAAANLPEDAVVYCSFNGTKKLTQAHWRRNMAILAQVPNSVLWLLGGFEATEQRLRDAAKAEGVAPERLIFAPALLNHEHLARYPLGDLFLDAAPCGGHTTASDALWMGVPVLTAPGRGFASRVCGSLVKAAGAEELICNSLDDYVRRAVELGQDRAQLTALRQKLVAQREHCTLFDPTRLMAHFDELLLQMWNDYEQGRLPQPDLKNLEIYNEIGSSLDRNDREMMREANYEDLYLSQLRERHAYEPISTDSRLWSGASSITVAKPAGRSKKASGK